MTSSMASRSWMAAVLRRGAQYRPTRTMPRGGFLYKSGDCCSASVPELACQGGYYVLLGQSDEGTGVTQSYHA